MKYFIDTEFKEYFKQHKILGIPVGYKTPTIDLISIGIVCENGSSYYALNKECDLSEICKDEWLWGNVITPIYTEYVHGDTRNYLGMNESTIKCIFRDFGRTRKEIVSEIVAFTHTDSPIEFYGYYSDYDWVVFCQLFGRMMNLPEGFPMYCRDLKQMMDDRGLSKEWKQKNCPDPKGEHNALVDAIWNKQLYDSIQEFNELVKTVESKFGIKI